MNQGEKRRYLIDALLSEQTKYRGVEIPSGETEQKQLLRGLMNIRMPGPIGEDVLRVQDEYLRETAQQKGITALDELTPVEPGIYAAIARGVGEMGVDHRLTPSQRPW